MPDQPTLKSFILMELQEWQDFRSEEWWFSTSGSGAIEPAAHVELPILVASGQRKAQSSSAALKKAAYGSAKPASQFRLALSSHGAVPLSHPGSFVV